MFECLIEIIFEGLFAGIIEGSVHKIFEYIRDFGFYISGLIFCRNPRSKSKLTFSKTFIKKEFNKEQTF